MLRPQFERLEDLAERLRLAAALRQVFQAVIDSVLQESRVFRHVDQPAQPHRPAWRAQHVRNGVAVRVATGQGSEVCLAQQLRRLRDTRADGVGNSHGLDGGDRRRRRTNGCTNRCPWEHRQRPALHVRHAPAREHRLQADATHVRSRDRPAQRVPHTGHRARVDHHGEGRRHALLSRGVDRLLAHRAQVRAAQLALAVLLHTVELHVELELPVRTVHVRQHPAESFVTSHTYRVGIHQHVADLRMLDGPAQDPLELRVDGRLAAGELQDVDEPLARHHALDTRAHLVERREFQVRAHAIRAFGVARGARQVAAVDDLDQCHAGGESLERIHSHATGGTGGARSFGRRAAPLRSTARATRIRRIAMALEVPPRIALEHHVERAVFGAFLLHEHRTVTLDDARRHVGPARRAPAPGELDDPLVSMDGDLDHVRAWSRWHRPCTRR